MANDGIPDNVTETNWREVAREMIVEQDSEKVFELAQELITKFNQENLRTKPARIGPMQKPF